ncbi:MAG TPA: AmmeMemoRadiSam system protein B [Deltaproteobacteria bacterium]|nr:AmmeMemoRadiSam system protein B [Deltaproteobacteria bacterium]
MLRPPAVAGTFYPAAPEALRREVLRCLAAESAPEKKQALGLIVPHAGYMYSGQVAGAVYARIAIPQKLVILCPNHTGYGAYAAINASGAWRTPLGEAPIDDALAMRLLELAPILEEDSAAHRREHSLEVQLPFLQELRPDFQFVPLCLSHFDYAACETLGHALARLIGESREEILMIASSDMNHYESQERTLIKDQRALDCILALDPAALYQSVHEENISMCGIIPATCMLIAARELGATRAELVKHATSGDVTGDFSGVVGYAGIVVA